MSSSDRLLGMDRNISRRDFINGVAAAGAAWALPSSARTLAAIDPDPSNPYPPERMGMRGSHPGSFESAHALRDTRQLDLSAAKDTGETYDLVIVGGGISGLSAAHYFMKSVGDGARILILDNHDDFGGHAKRNEISVKGRTVVLNGGTLEIESPGRYNRYAMEMFADIGVDLERYIHANATNHELYASLGMRSSYFFEKETFGSDRLIVEPPAAGGHEGRRHFSAEYLRHMPISNQAKADLLRLEDPDQPDYLGHLGHPQHAGEEQEGGDAQHPLQDQDQRGQQEAVLRVGREEDVCQFGHDQRGQTADGGLAEQRHDLTGVGLDQQLTVAVGGEEGAAGVARCKAAPLSPSAIPMITCGVESTVERINAARAPAPVEKIAIRAGVRVSDSA